MNTLHTLLQQAEGQRDQALAALQRAEELARRAQAVPGFTNALLDQVKGDKNAPIALICRTGNRTTQVQRYLQSQGFTQVYNVKEGMAGSMAGPGWLRRGLPVESCTAQC